MLNTLYDDFKRVKVCGDVNTNPQYFSELRLKYNYIALRRNVICVELNKCDIFVNNNISKNVRFNKNTGHFISI